MKHKTLFRLMLRLMGVYFIIQSATSLIQWAVWIGENFLFSSSGIAVTNIVGGLLASAFMLACGIYLFRGGQWIVDRAIPSNRPYCPECGYELTTASSERCPECGTRICGRVDGQRPAPDHQ